MSTKVHEIIEQLKTLTLLEAAELVKEIETTFNVSAAASMGSVSIAAPSASGATQEVEEKTEFDLVLEEVPADKKIAVLKVVRTLTGLGLKSKRPRRIYSKNIKEGASKDDVEAAKKQLEEAGAKVKIK
uniref:Ribosomal protein L12 n=1 Tax=Cryptomonas curvata TaxID=233186 RepID=A0A222AH60_9CRYP|nr:ribosomal protein L12 [Cryptomonas curvata]ASO75708.1 ribosomal protein L12 [Cryptomonas curvata]